MKLSNRVIMLPVITILSLNIYTFSWLHRNPGLLQITSLKKFVTIGTRSHDRGIEDSLVPVDIITADELLRSPNIAGELGGLLQAAVASFSMPRQSQLRFYRYCQISAIKGFKS